MPVYLLHGFRWPRPLIRIHVILQNLEDAAPEWLVAPETQRCLVENFWKLYPEQMANLPNLRFIEQYNPDDEVTNSQPYAYVADTVHKVELGVAVEDVIGGGVKNETWEALIEIRDQLCHDQKVGWFVVVCGDEERYFPPTPVTTPPVPTSASHPSFRNSHRSNGSHAHVYSESGSDFGYPNGHSNDQPAQSPTATRKRSSSIGRSLRRVFGASSSQAKKEQKELKQSKSMRNINTSASAVPPNHNSASVYSLQAPSRPTTSASHKNTHNSSNNHSKELPPLPNHPQHQSSSARVAPSPRPGWLDWMHRCLNLRDA